MKRAKAAVIFEMAAACLLLVGCGGGVASDQRTTTAASGSASPSPSSSITSGVYGYVTAGPTCPVERVDQPCPPRPVPTVVEARGVGGAVASTESDGSGRYEFHLPPGSYVIVVGGSAAWPRCPETPVSLMAGVTTRADISCDTGIR
jgi:hypothetical protein